MGGRLLPLCTVVLAATGLALGGALAVGSLASAPAPAAIGAPPSDLPIEPAVFDSASGSRLSGWLVPGQPHMGAVLLLHGVRANRLQMLGRAKFLHRAGFSVLLFDFQAHGQSAGRHITFGHLEALDARAAFDYLRSKSPGERIGVLGLSLGGAAAVVGEPPLDADAMVLEAVYASFAAAVQNRLVMRLGAFGRYLEPMLTWQVKPRLGFDPEALQPAKRIAAARAPLLLIAGDADRHATLNDVNLLYASAPAAKELWIIAGAGHVDFHRHVAVEYERRILEFLRPRLKS